ncbi:MAG: DUF2179 domain-containing protein [Mycoplasmoidaceae bacterium]|nr:DUF2179 domain-containing protein [Mycoplasmoidaceae bacterium]
MVRVEIFSSPQNITNINTKLKNIKYTHPSTITDGVGGYSHGKTTVFVTIMQCIELPEFIRVIRSVDQKCLISVVHMADLDGYMTMQKQVC